MSQWAVDSKKESAESQGKPESSSVEEPLKSESILKTENEATELSGNNLSSNKKVLAKAALYWSQVVPFILSAAFFLSRFFAVFAPLPLLILYFQKGRRMTWLATFSNAAIVGALGGVKSLLFYSVFVVGLTLCLPEMLSRKKSLIKSVTASLVSMAMVGFIVLASYSVIKKVNLVTELNQTVSSLVDSLSKSVLSEPTWMDPSEIEILKKGIVLEFPSAVATFALILVWANLMLLLRVNPGSIKEKIGIEANALNQWKAPDFLIWPVLAGGFFLLGDFGIASDVALNVFKFLMAVYVIQGLSILSYFLEFWKIRGVFRVAGLVLPVVMSAPLVAGLGFFDLWFDFRSKLKHS